MLSLKVCTTSIQIKTVIVFRWAFLSLRIKFKIDIRKVSLLFICWMKYIQEHSRHSRECLYYNRFVSYEYQFHSIIISIEFIDEGFEPFFDTISYRIEEKGYPTLSINNVFEYCGAQLERSNNKLTGDYVHQCVNSSL